MGRGRGLRIGYFWCPFNIIAVSISKHHLELFLKVVHQGWDLLQIHRLHGRRHPFDHSLPNSLSLSNFNVFTSMDLETFLVVTADCTLLAVASTLKSFQLRKVPPRTSMDIRDGHIMSIISTYLPKLTIFWAKNGSAWLYFQFWEPKTSLLFSPLGFIHPQE